MFVIFEIMRRSTLHIISELYHFSNFKDFYTSAQA